METLILTCTILSVILSIIAIGLGLYAVIGFESMKRSTHKIEYMPVEVPAFTANQDKEFKETLNEDFTESFIL